MDLRGADQITQYREMIDRAMLGLNTSCPGIIDSFDGKTAVVIPAIKMKITVRGVVSYLDMPPIIQVPVVLPFDSVGGFGLTVPIQKGCNCLLVFSQRYIDNWVQHGDIQPPEQEGIPGGRHHSITDAIAIIAPATLIDAFSSWCMDGLELRNKAKTTRVTVKDDKVEIVSGPTSITVNTDGMVSIVAPESMSIVTPLLTVTGDLVVTGYIQDGVRKMSEDRAIYDSHTHTDPQGGAVSPPSQPE